MSGNWGVPTQVEMEYSWPNSSLGKPNNSQEIPIPWGSDRPSAPSENNLNNLTSKKVAQGSWGPNRSENSYISRNDVVQVDHFTEKPLPEKEPARFSDNVSPANTKSPSGNDKINDQRENDEELAVSFAYQAVIEQSFESYKENERHATGLDDDNWDPVYHNIIPASSDPQLDVHKAKGRAESSITTSPNPTLPKKKVCDKGVQTDPIDLTKIMIIASSKEKLLSCTIDSQIMKDYQQDVSEKKHIPQAPSLLDLGPEEWNNTFNKSTNVESIESYRNIPPGKSDFHDNTAVIPPTMPETNARGPDNDSLGSKSRTPPNNENPSLNNNWNAGSQSIPPEPGSWNSPPPQIKSDWGTVSQQTPAQNNVFSQPVQVNKNNRDSNIQQPYPRPNDAIPQEPQKELNENRAPKVQNDRSQGPLDTSNDNRGGETQRPNINKADSWGDPLSQTGGSDWMKQAEAFSKELGEVNVNKPDNLEGASNKDSNNITQPQAGSSDWMKKAEMYSKELEGNSVKETSGQKKYETDQKADDSYGNDDYYSNNRYGNRDSSRDGSRDGNRYGNRYGNSNRKTCNKCGKEGHFARDCTEENRGGYGNGTTCHRCGKEGHFARDCTEENRGGYGSITCHKCGKEGHMARDCTDENRGGYGSRMTCRKCNKEGHIARDCPDEICYRCNKPGHRSNDCNEDAYETTGENGKFGVGHEELKPSPFSNPGPSNVSSQEAWAKLIKADKEEELDDFKDALELYAKVTPGETFQSIEKKLRDSSCNARIIALKREEVPFTKVLVDLQGNANKKYVATPVMVPPSRLSRAAGERASDEKENLEWLADSGFMVDDTAPVCHNCKQKGHASRECPEPKREIEKHPHLICQNCHSPEHITKYCNAERRDYYTEARDRRAAGSYNRDPNNDKASSVYDGEEDRKGFRGYGSNSSQTCHNCNREGHISRDCPEKRNVRKCFNCGEEGHLSKDCKDLNKINHNDNNKTASRDTYDDNSRSKSGSVNNDYAQDRDFINDNARDPSLSTQDKTLQQKDISPSNTVKVNTVEKDSWEATQNNTQQVEWGSGAKKLEDFGWGMSNNNKEPAPDYNENRRGRDNDLNEGGRYNKGPEDHENRRGDPYNKGSDDFRRGRGNDSYNKSSDDYGRGRDNGSYNNKGSDDYGRNRNNNYNNNYKNNSYNKGPDDYGRGRGPDDYGRGRSNDSYNKSSDDYGRGRGNNSYNKGYDDYERGRGNDPYNKDSDDYGRDRGNDSYNKSSDDWRARSNSSYNKGSDDHGRGRGNDSYNKSSDDWRARSNSSYNKGSDDYGRGRGPDDYGRGRGNDSYNKGNDDYGRGRDDWRGRSNNSYNKGNDDYGRGRGNDDYGRSRGNDSYNKGPDDYGRSRGNDYSRGPGDYGNRRDRDDGRWTKSNTQDSREQTTQPNANTPEPNLVAETWW